MAKKTKKVEKLSYNEAMELQKAIERLKLDTYKDTMEFNRVYDVLKAEVNAFNNQNAELMVKYEASEKDGMLRMERSNPNFAKFIKESNELAMSESKVTRTQVEFLTIDQFDWATDTKEEIPAKMKGIIAKWCVKGESDQ